VIASSAAIAAVGISSYVFASGVGALMLGTVVFGLAIGASSTAAYTAAGAVIPPEARGAGFGLLSTGSLMGLAISPIVCGLLATQSLRAVFVLDAVALLLVAGLVLRLMATAQAVPTTAPATEEV
jgi:MFS family permease